MEKVYCVVSHTHWDREWYKPFEQFRIHLTSLINNLLDVLEQYPDFIFHLDAQTIVLEDYLEIYPENWRILQKHIKAGNIIVGPWYLQNDFFLTSGEATIRNLLEGNRLANSFGACGKVGYAPDQFGNISQLPQILQNFGVDNFIFGRGFDRYHKAEDGKMVKDNIPSEFIWEAPDGSKVLAIYMKYWYNNAQRFSKNTEFATKLVNGIEKQFEGVAVTPYLLLMNGVDHLEAQEDLLPILDELNNQKINGTIKQVNMFDYTRMVKSFVEENEIALLNHKGELRMGSDRQILQGTLSSRSYLKQLNVKAQNTLENKIEPLYTMLENAGLKGIYPKNYLRYLWKSLMKNHPHDSICGCSRDMIHDHMEDRFKSIKEVTDVLIKDGLTELAQHSNVAKKYPEEYSLSVVNTIGCLQSGVIEAEVVFLKDDNVKGFKILDENDQEVPYEIISAQEKPFDVFSGINLPGTFEATFYRVYLYADSVKPFSAKNFTVVKTDTLKEKLNLISKNKPILENDNLKVKVNKNGSIDILEKSTDRLLTDCIYLEDILEKGDSYRCVTDNSKPFTTSSLKPRIKVIENNDYKSCVELFYKWSVPAFYDYSLKARSKEQTVMPTYLTLTLYKNSNTLEVSYKINNTARDHRVKLCVNTDVASNYFVADIPFDIIKREDGFMHPDTESNDWPNTSFAAIENDNKGVAVFTEGNQETSKQTENGIKVTLFRSFNTINRNPDETAGGGDNWQCEGGQCLREMSGRFGICLYKGDSNSANVINKALAFRTGLLNICMPCDRTKFTGGRCDVQDSTIAELFYRDDKYPTALAAEDTLPPVEIIGKNVIVTALKQKEDGNGYIVRFLQYSKSPQTVKVKAKGKIYITNMAETTEKLLGENNVEISVNGKRIITLKIEI